ncbi:MAG: heavy-metal-associated domain-containing protein [Chlorobium sp.]|nr:heavy-metal-associated domain-containing protein [Chlorobium sp.]MCW8816131.1 heavy-metal-associated domain-containing protein [Chlorobium sp.]MCW8820035.1 heavy-metal-associated domain-containing protein [Ignavibacteriaceae bacterium]
MKTITMNVGGMHCGSCETVVREVLEEVGGVEKAEVSHSAGTVLVVYDERRVSPATLKTAIENEGYSVGG